MGKKSVLRKAKAGSEGIVLNNRYKWVSFTTEDDQVVRAKVRTSLVNDEVEYLSTIDLNGEQEKLWEATAKYVIDWNCQVQDEEDGEIYDIIPPAEGGPESFNYAPRGLVLAIVGALIVEPFAKLDPKSLTPVESTDEPYSGSGEQMARAS